MLRKRNVSPLLLLAVAASPPPLRGKLVEQYSERPQVSGSAYVVGLMAGPLAGAADVAALKVLIPGSGSRREVCVDLATRDGAYSAHGRFVAEGGGGGLAPLAPETPPRYRKELATRPRQDLVGVARLGPRCDTLAATDLVALAYQVPVETVGLYLLSRGARSVTASLDAGGGAKPAQCSRLRGRAVAFDTYCAARLPSGSGGPVRIIVSVVGLDTVRSETSYRLWLPE